MLQARKLKSDGRLSSTLLFQSRTKRGTFMGMAGPYYCLLCGCKEEDCKCERFCSICQNDYNVRLCIDGNYYCKECREACEYEAQG
jgi:hypothetical protein